MDATSIPGLLGSELFVQYAARWLELVESSDSKGLRQCFEVVPPRTADKGDSSRLLALHFPLRQVVRLVSTVGATRIKASFVVVPGPDGQPRFSVVLSASNGLGARLSSYYLAADYQLPVGDADRPGPADQSAALALGATPGVLARTWRQLWRRVREVTPALFAGTYGFLRGYAFTISDFAAALAGVQDADEGSLVVHFGLHEYYRPDPVAGDVLALTFGLILQLGDASKDQKGGGGSDPFYDMSQPCPPNC